MKSYAYLFWAYNVIWLGLAGFLLFLLLRLRRVDRRLDGIERAQRGRGRVDQESRDS